MLPCRSPRFPHAQATRTTQPCAASNSYAPDPENEPLTIERVNSRLTPGRTGMPRAPRRPIWMPLRARFSEARTRELAEGMGAVRPPIHRYVRPSGPHRPNRSHALRHPDCTREGHAARQSGQDCGDDEAAAKNVRRRRRPLAPCGRQSSAPPGRVTDPRGRGKAFFPAPESTVGKAKSLTRPTVAPSKVPCSIPVDT